MTKKSNKFTAQDVLKELEKCRTNLLQQAGGGSVLSVHPNARARELFPNWENGKQVNVGRDKPVVCLQSIGEWPTDIAYQFQSLDDVVIVLVSKEKNGPKFLTGLLVCPARMIRGLKASLPDPDGWDC